MFLGKAKYLFVLSLILLGYSRTYSSATPSDYSDIVSDNIIDNQTNRTFIYSNSSSKNESIPDAEFNKTEEESLYKLCNTKNKLTESLYFKILSIIPTKQNCLYSSTENNFFSCLHFLHTAVRRHIILQNIRV